MSSSENAAFTSIPVQSIHDETKDEIINQYHQNRTSEEHVESEPKRKSRFCCRK